MNGMERWLGLGVLAKNLRRIARESGREAQQKGRPGTKKQSAAENEE
jgi:hypothetical protein